MNTGNCGGRDVRKYSGLSTFSFFFPRAFSEGGGGKVESTSILLGGADFEIFSGSIIMSVGRVKILMILVSREVSNVFFGFEVVSVGAESWILIILFRFLRGLIGLNTVEAFFLERVFWATRVSSSEEESAGVSVLLSLLFLVSDIKVVKYI